MIKQLHDIQVLGDSILKGIQVDPQTGKYITKNEMDSRRIAKDYALEIENHSHFGCTITKGAKLLDRMLERGMACDAVVMDFGGNDCDYKWPEIAENPDGIHLPAVPLGEFVDQYRKVIGKLKERGIVPILTTLPPLEPQRFFDWWCGGLNQENVLRWMGGVVNIYAHQENYSRAVEDVARMEQVPLVDIRRAFLHHGRIGDLICADGTHPNSTGQQLITEAFEEFAVQYRKRELLEA